MSASRVQRMARDGWIALRQMAVAALGWLFGYPLTLLVRRDPYLTIVIGRRGPVFADNSKYFFVCASQRMSEGERVVFLTSDPVLAAEIGAAGGAAVVHPSWRSLFLALRCGRVVVDMADWFDFGIYPLSCGAQTVQLWHGAPLKHIELDLFRERLRAMPGVVRQLLVWQKALLGRYPVYDVVVSTSLAFIDRAFSRSFSARQFLATGYPRNDVLLRGLEPGSVGERLVSINVDREALDLVGAAHADGRKVALYVPTFRGGMESPFTGAIDLARWSTFAGEHGLLIMVKLHPFMHGQYHFDQYPNLREYASLADIYPVMAKCDLLITDYSSIYLDYLLLDRPMVFFAYDLEQYQSQDRTLYFSYDSMTPGAKCGTQAELEWALSAILDAGCQDGYAAQRARVRRFTHDYADGVSAGRLLNRLGYSGTSAAKSS